MERISTFTTVLQFSSSATGIEMHTIKPTHILWQESRKKTRQHVVFIALWLSSFQSIYVYYALSQYRQLLQIKRL